MADHEHFTKEQIIEAVKSSKGFMSKAAALLGCSYTTIWNYREKYPEVKEILHDIKEARKDMAEEKLQDNVELGKEVSLLFFLKTQCQDRGYIEKQQIQHSGMVMTERILDALPDELRNEVIEKLKSDIES